MSEGSGSADQDERPSEYLLLYGHTGGEVRRGQPPARQAMANVVAVLLAMMGDAVAAGDVDIERMEAATPETLRGQLTLWRAAMGGISLPDGALAACLIGYAQLHGAITLELVAHLPPQISERDALFDLEMAHIAAARHPPRRG